MLHALLVAERNNASLDAAASAAATVVSERDLTAETDIPQGISQQSQQTPRCTTSLDEEPAAPVPDGPALAWAQEWLQNYTPSRIEASNKMVLLLDILQQTVLHGEKLLVFTQSLDTLDLIETFLARTLIPGTLTHWAKNVSYFRLDGSTLAQVGWGILSFFPPPSGVLLVASHIYMAWKVFFALVHKFNSGRIWSNNVLLMSNALVFFFAGATTAD